MNQRHFKGDIIVEEVAEGLLIRQHGEGYVARNWRLCPATEELIEAAIGAGLGCMIRDSHPRRNARWPNPRGVVYLAFSPDETSQWSLAIDTFNPRRDDYGFAVFNGKYHEQFLKAGIPFTFEGRNRTAGHLVVARERVLEAINALAVFDHSVLTLNRIAHSETGFTTEYVIQRQILKNWRETPWGRDYEIVQDEFPVDGGRNSRRIDILARHRKNGDWLVVELKRAEATPDAVGQAADYLRALAQRDEFNHGRLEAVVIAERFQKSARKLAEVEGIDLYQIGWPATLTMV
ncbi:hypothetical protein BMI91_00065 [Thioclava sediminum]|uniref:Endonuclease NucS C-terminal domain-containing protein n=1 Tax=Thioclava sediminum TaxID=1915319 RepID=A0ABX3MZS4_9RHOB|nr:endonuclease NucS domain-containing protein [Thioclava sediminum]OOY24887.1 hypothetical protein BMI91_00065 [Thioclava sediminum]